MEWWDRMMEAQLQNMLEENLLQVWSTVLQDSFDALNQWSTCDVISHVARLHRSRDQKAEVGMALSQL